MARRRHRSSSGLIGGETLASSLASKPDNWLDQHAALTFLAQLAETVMELHARGTTHGDLKPDNIIVRDGEAREPVLVDTIDFAPTSDGDIASSAYAPEAGSRQERDNFAVTKIAEEVLAKCSIDPRAGAAIATAIRTCRNNVPQNATLLPLVDALDAARAPSSEAPRFSIALSIRGAATGRVFPDEGRLYLRARGDVSALVIRGIGEEVEIRLDVNGVPFSGRRRSVSQGWIARVSKYEFKSIEADLEVASSEFNDFSELAALLQDADVQEALGQAKEPKRVDAADEEESGDREELGDVAEDTLVEEITVARAVQEIAFNDLHLQRDVEPVRCSPRATPKQHLAGLDHLTAGQRLQAVAIELTVRVAPCRPALPQCVGLAIKPLVAARRAGMIPAPTILLTRTETAFAACGLLRTKSRMRSRKSAPAIAISTSADVFGARQPSVRRPRAAPS